MGKASAGADGAGDLAGPVFFDGDGDGYHYFQSCFSGALDRSSAAPQHFYSSAAYRQRLCDGDFRRHAHGHALAGALAAD